MNRTEELKKGCGKELVHYKPLIEPLICGEVLNEETVLCPICKAELKGRQDVLKEVLNFIENQRDNGNMLANEKGFSAGICLSELMKEIQKQLNKEEDEKNQQLQHKLLKDL